ncbi:hypothetical protein F4604DRAFT_1119448 [Suillus subluteus]|nr:hypothetical protein F4604DRAFT_1119448 [Suillus subluteus]
MFLMQPFPSLHLKPLLTLRCSQPCFQRFAHLILVSVFSFANTAPNTSFIGIMQHNYQCNMVVDLGCGGALRTAEWELIKNCAFIRTASTAHATNLMGGARRIWKGKSFDAYACNVTDTSALLPTQSRYVFI